ncbi:MAG: MBL fold metallo-hydrolase [Desulfobulbaceae bacterium]|nr:MBL fold metallo-hydrolase [Desulfobulbaceae bacterium]
MRTFLGCVLCCVFLSVTCRIVQAAEGLVRVADHVYSYVAVAAPSAVNSYGANAGIIIGDRSVLVVDTLISAKEAKRFINDIKKITDKPIESVVNTHYHLDHSFGNAEFVKKGAAIISHVDCKRSMQENAEKTLANADQYGLTPEDMVGTTVSYPLLTFSETMQLDLGNLKVELIHVAHAHTKGSILVYIPKVNVVFAGDVMFTDFHPYMADGNIEGWLQTLDFLDNLKADKIIPGHGPLSGAKDITEMKSYLVAFDKMAKKLVAENLDVDAIAKNMEEKLPHRSAGQWIIKANIAGKYLPKQNTSH